MGTPIPVFSEFNIEGYKLKKLNNFSQIFYLPEKIGSGTEGEVFVYEMLKNGDFQEVAVKETNLNSLDPDTLSEHLKSLLIYEELNNLDFMPKYIDLFLFEKGENLYSALVTEYIIGYTLDKYIDFLISENSYTPNKLFLEFSTWLVSSVKKLHDLGIVHRDIKPSNIMLSSGIFYLIDFGMSCSLIEEKNICPNILRGTRYYMSPEINILGKDFIELFKNNKEILYSADNWAVGMTLYELLEHVIPWSDDNDDLSLLLEQMIKYKHKEFEFSYEHDNFEIIDVITGLLKPNINERSSLEETLQKLGKIII